jgi:hypothetical protein
MMDSTISVNHHYFFCIKLQKIIYLLLFNISFLLLMELRDQYSP